MTAVRPQPTESDLADARTVWDYHLVGHPLRSCDVAIGLGSHDLGVAAFAAGLYHKGLFPTVVFTGANSPTTATRFPDGEAIAYRDYAIQLGVPASAILVEPKATNTGDNIELSRAVLQEAGLAPATVLLICKPYMERRAYATCRKLWPEVEPICASEPLSFDDYVRSIGSAGLVIDMLVGDLQRVIAYPSRGFAIPQEVPANVTSAYRRLIDGGFTSRLMPT